MPGSQPICTEQDLAPSLVKAVGVEANHRVPSDEQNSQLRKLTEEVVSALKRKVEALQRGTTQPGGTNKSANRSQNPCPICGERGHWSHYCPKKSDGKRDKVVRLKCQQPGHMARGCANF